MAEGVVRPGKPDRREPLPAVPFAFSPLLSDDKQERSPRRADTPKIVGPATAAEFCHRREVELHLE
jgi:hypothetical protein